MFRRTVPETFRRAPTPPGRRHDAQVECDYGLSVLRNSLGSIPVSRLNSAENRLAQVYPTARPTCSMVRPGWRSNIYFPGGFGTLDELAEILTLIQTEKANRAPVILFDTAFWSDLDAFFRNHMLAEGAIVEKDLDIYTITDSVDEIIELVQANKTYC